MRVALMFGEYDVDAFKAEVDADTWAKWQQFEAIEPSGWRGLQAMAGHLAYWILKSAAPKAQISYAKMAPEFRPLLDAPIDPRLEAARWKAWADTTRDRPGTV